MTLSMIFFVDGLLCLCCLWFTRSEFLWTKEHSRLGPAYPVIWAVLALVLGLLALQEVSGLLNVITDSARHDAITGGWYADRRPFQWLLVKTVPVITLSVGLGALWSIRKAWRRYLLVVTATLYWVSYAAIEGISFHNIDWLLRQHTAGLQNKTWGDLGGMALTAAALLVAWRMDQGHPSIVTGRRNDVPPPATTWQGRLRRLAWTEKQSFVAEQRRLADWLHRYRLHRQKRAPGHKIPKPRR